MSYISFLLPVYFSISLFSFGGPIGQLIKFIFLAIVCLSIFQKRNKPYLNKETLRISLFYIISVLLLCIIHSIVYNVPSILLSIISWLLVFFLMSSIEFKGKADVIVKSISTTVVVLDLVLLYFCFTQGDFSYYPRSDIRNSVGLDKPNFSLYYSVYFCLAYLACLKKKNLKFHLIIFPLSFFLNIYLIQSKLALTAFILFALVHYLLNKEKLYKKRIKKMLKIIIFVVLSFILIQPSMLSIPDEFKILVNQVVGENVLDYTKELKDDNTYTIRSAIKAYCFNLFLQHPLVGIGLGNYKEKAGSNVTFDIGYGNYLTIKETESQILQIMVEGGIWYLASFLVLSIYILRGLILNLKKHSFEFSVCEAFAIALPLFYICFGNDFFNITFWIMLGFSLSRSSDIKKGK